MIKRHFTLAALAAAALLTQSAHAVVVDLVNTDQGAAGGPMPAIFQFTDQQPTGTGVIDPFLTIQADGTEQGYNTSGSPAPFDVKRQPQYTHDIQFSDLQATTVMLNGTAYFQILLDVNEPNGAKSIIKLYELQIYTSPLGSQTTTNVATLGTLRYDLDGSGDSQVVIDAGRNHGSGSGDVNIFIPVSAFAGTAPSDYIYVYALFSEGNLKSNPDGTQGGFEEFALVNNITPVPEMSALFPIVGLMVAVGSTHVLRRRRMAKASV